VNIDSLDLIDKITLVDKISEITKIGSIGVIGKDASPVERRSTISNSGVVPQWTNYATGTNYDGKFFTSHCMGFINTIDVFCKNDGASERTITVYISPNPDLGYVAKANITVPASATMAWRSATFNRMWLSDKLFVFIELSHLDVKYAYDDDDTTKRDCFHSMDKGVSWFSNDTRNWFRVVMKGQEEGYSNISGTINNIPLPSQSSGTYEENIEVADSSLTSVLKIEGNGFIQRIVLHTTHDAVEIRFKIDGVAYSERALLALYPFTGENLNLLGLTSETQQIQLYLHNEDGLCVFAVTVPYEFKKSFEVLAYHEIGLAKNVSCAVTVKGLS